MSTYSTELFARAQTVMPGGVNSPVRAFHGVGGTPIIFKQGKGPYLIDLEDKKYVDYVCSWGPMILGHAHPIVQEAVIKAAGLGLSFGASTLIEVEMAECLSLLMPSIEKVRMVSSGTEATQSAIRLARGFTGRTKIVKFQGCYHGHSDSLLVKGGSGLLTLGLPDSLGIPEDFAKHTIIAPFNDVDAIKHIFETFGKEIAAIIVEPIAGNMNCIPPLPAFLPTLRQLCDQFGSLLIFDEVITGFRVALQGAQALYNIRPDITCLGKIIGGGLPVGAFGGRRDIMDFLAPDGPVYQAGTLSGNPVALSAGLATLKFLQQHPDIYMNLQNRTLSFTTRLKDLSLLHGIPLQTQQIGSMFGLFFTEEDAITNYNQVQNCNIKHFKQFFHGMLKEGVYFAPSAFEVGFVSLAHTESVLDFTLEAADRVFQTWTEKN